jgi:zinc/manganese transport system ATP-binding protein
VLHLLAGLAREGMSVLLTTHDLNGMAAHLPHVVALNGRVVATGRPEDVIRPAVLEEVYGARLEVLEHLGIPVVVDRSHREVAS